MLSSRKSMGTSCLRTHCSELVAKLIDSIPIPQHGKPRQVYSQTSLSLHLTRMTSAQLVPSAIRDSEKQAMQNVVFTMTPTPAHYGRRGDMSSRTLKPAAEYVRMSTAEQYYSVAIQQAANRQYAQNRGFEIIVTYCDLGKSGVGINHRPELRKLIQDVVSGHPSFVAILVYDVSRWGRFQDIDESAHYEFLCRSAGIPVHYCAEQFENDGTMPSEMMKALKRTMAAEYSRELSTKVRAGMRILASKGFRAGGNTGYGLRRMMITSQGRKRQILEANERKNIQSDHVVLVPGPDREIKVIKLIFALAAKDRMSPKQIAEELTRRKIVYCEGNRWNKLRVYSVLKNEKYTGANVWGKTKKPFGKPTQKMPCNEWTRKDGAFVPLVAAAEFARVQRLLRLRNNKIKKPTSYFLNSMRRLLAREGKLTHKLLKQKGPFDPRAYILRFGSTMRAYELIGYKPPVHAFSSIAAWRQLQALRNQLLARLVQLFPNQLRIVQLPRGGCRKSVELAGGLKIAVHLCRPLPPSLEGARWMLVGHPNEKDLISLICLTDKSLDNFIGLYLVPEVGSIMNRYKVLREGHPLLAAGKHLESLSQFHDAAMQVANRSNTDDITVVDDIEFGQRALLLSVGGKKIQLSNIEARIMGLLLRNAGRVVPTPALREHARNPAEWFTRAHISALRKKLGKFRGRIVTVKGKGYSYYDPQKARDSGRAASPRGRTGSRVSSSLPA
jgi:DNA invertase Pin-like site-specific DNA recombinase/DNA-binding winged helix-turn-helix (wHTH) protein